MRYMKACFMMFVFVISMALLITPARAAATGGQYISARVEGTARYDLAAECLSVINAYRRSCGAGDVIIDRELEAHAMQRAAEQVCYYGHTRPDGSGGLDGRLFDGTWRGETALLTVKTATADSIIGAFRRSLEHDKIMKDKVYKAVGIGLVETGDKILVVFNFRSSGTPAKLSAKKEQKTWTYQVCPDFFKPAVNQSSLRVEDGRTTLTVTGRNYIIPTLKLQYRITGGLSSVLSSRPDVLDTSGFTLIPVSAGKAMLNITACGRVYAVPMTVTGGSHAAETPSGTSGTAGSGNTTKTRYDGVYTFFAAKNRAYAMDVANGSTASGANIQLYRANGTLAQKFRVEYVGDGYYKVTNIRSGKALDVKGGYLRSGTNVQQYIWNGTSAQLWQFRENGDGTVTLISRLGTALDVSGGLMQNNRNIQTYTPNGTIAQRWVLKRVS